MYALVCICADVSCLATKVFIGDLLAMGRGQVIIKLASDEGQLPTNRVCMHVRL